ITARDDDTVGETVSGSTHNPGTNYYGSSALQIPDASAIKYVRISYAAKGVSYPNLRTDYSISHAQFINCNYAIEGLGDDNAAFTLHNGLIWNVPPFMTGNFWFGYGEHLTLYQATNGNCTANFTNCLFVATSGFSGGTSNAFISNPTGVFQTVGAGSA